LKNYVVKLIILLTVNCIASTAVDSKQNNTAECTEESIKVTSWNIKHLGKSKDAAEIVTIGNLLIDSDIIGIQEVVAGNGGPKAVERLHRYLTTKNKHWKYSLSSKTSGSGTERYAYLWKTNKATSQNGTLSPALEVGIDREPYIQTFNINGRELILVNFHAVPTDKHPSKEIEQLHTSPLIKSSSTGLIMGDFNLSYKENAFNDLRALNYKSHIRGKTSLKIKRSNGMHLSKEYDNIFTKGITVCDTGITDFSPTYPTLKEARNISDHLPIWIKIN
jgi:deoxyribonuclease-1-like protein